MQLYPLLQTKLHIPPVRPGLVLRPRLFERLNAGLPTTVGLSQTPEALFPPPEAFSRGLTLISAPAGFGKTTLVSEWVHHLQLHASEEGQINYGIAWLSLDEGDSDLVRFLIYTIAALRTIQPDIGDVVLSALQSPQPPPAEVVLISLINELAAIPSRTILVLDDYHTIDSSEVENALAFLLERLPTRMHLVIATREDPTLPLARLRARGQLTEVRALDLRFTLSEAAEFLNRVMGLDLSGEDIVTLEARTEGWIAGLHLAALALQGLAMRGTSYSSGEKDTSNFIESFAGSHRYVLDYLIEEVLDQQPETIHAFLLPTAILDRLTGSLCNALTGRDDGQVILEMLDRANLFIVPLDSERCWYRYHHLFADLLRERLRRTELDQVSTLHLRASQWYELNGFTDEAIDHALRGEDFERAARLLEEHADAMWTRGEHAKLRSSLACLPGEVVLRRPLLSVFRGWFLYTKGLQDAAEQYLQAAEGELDLNTEGLTETTLPQQVSLPASDRQELRGRAAVIRAFIATHRGNVPAIIDHARQALDFLPEQDLVWRSTAAIALGDAQGFRGDMEAAYQARLEAAEASAAAGNTVFSLLAHTKVAITLRELGRLQRTAEVCQQQIELAGKLGLSGGSVSGCLWAIWGEVLAELGDLEGALAHARSGMEQVERGQDWSLLGWSCLCLIRVLFSTGDTVGAREIVSRLENTSGQANVPPWITGQMASWQARLWLAQGELRAASQWALERELHVAGEPIPLHEMSYFALFDYLVLARILLAQGHLGEATRLLEHLLKAAEAGGRTSKVIEILNLQALSLQAQGDTEQAITRLKRALTLAEPEGFVHAFVDEGPLMARLLYESANHDLASEYARRLMAAFPVAQPDESELPEPGTPANEMIEPLSERELEVLQLIAEGFTNREIASRLYLSLNTVKGHSRNIYGKLSVHSRTQAVAQARALGLLPSV
jgi:LuxR family maltose regulon positive regulatory protein